MNKINDLKVGDRVIRYFHQLSAEDMYVIEISDDVIVCALRACAKINSDLFSEILCNSRREESNVYRG